MTAFAGVVNTLPGVTVHVLSQIGKEGMTTVLLGGRPASLARAVDASVLDTLSARWITTLAGKVSTFLEAIGVRREELVWKKGGDTPQPDDLIRVMPYPDVRTRGVPRDILLAPEERVEAPLDILLDL